MKLILLAIFIGALTILVHGRETESTKSSKIARPTRSFAWPNTRGTIVRIFKKRSVDDDEFSSNENSFDRGTRGSNLFLRNSKSMSDEISPNEISTERNTRSNLFLRNSKAWNNENSPQGISQRSNGLFLRNFRSINEISPDENGFDRGMRSNLFLRNSKALNERVQPRILRNNAGLFLRTSKRSSGIFLRTSRAQELYKSELLFTNVLNFPNISQSCFSFSIFQDWLMPLLITITMLVKPEYPKAVMDYFYETFKIIFQLEFCQQTGWRRRLFFKY